MGMFDTFDRTPEGYIPHNTCDNICQESIDEIIVGGSCEHVFILHFLYSEDCNSCRVVYKQNAATIIEKTASELEIQEDPNRYKTYIAVKLTPEETIKFNKLFDAKAQLKLELKNGTVILGEINDIRVVETLEDN